MTEKESTPCWDVKQVKRRRLHNEDMRKLKECVIMPTDSNYKKDAPHLCVQNAKMNEFNNSLLV